LLPRRKAAGKLLNGLEKGEKRGSVFEEEGQHTKDTYLAPFEDSNSVWSREQWLDSEANL
jgi:hypothetical protein